MSSKRFYTSCNFSMLDFLSETETDRDSIYWPYLQWNINRVSKYSHRNLELREVSFESYLVNAFLISTNYLLFYTCPCTVCIQQADEYLIMWPEFSGIWACAKQIANRAVNQIEFWPPYCARRTSLHFKKIGKAKPLFFASSRKSDGQKSVLSEPQELHRQQNPPKSPKVGRKGAFPNRFFDWHENHCYSKIMLGPFFHSKLYWHN